MFRRRILLPAALGLPLWGACDVPTEPPMWEQTWVVPGDAIELGVAELLPPGVAVNADSSAFVTTVPATDVTASLASMCPACVTLDGLVAPKPEFTDTITTTTTLSQDLVSATLSGGGFDMVFEHELDFDPLRPGSDPSDPRGFLVISVLSDGQTVAHDSISGDDTAFPAGTQLVPVLPVRPVDVANALVVRVIVYSPAGDPVLIDTSDTVGLAMAPSPVEATSATIAVSDLAVAGPATTLDFGALDATAIERVRSGALRVHVENPFTATGSLGIEFDLGGGGTLAKSLALEEGTYDARVELTGTELQDVLGAGEVDVTAAGTVSATGGTVTVSPEQVLVLEADFELVVLIGGEGS